MGPSEFAGRVQDLTEALTDAENHYDERVGDLENTIADLKGELAERATTIAMLQGKLADLEQRNKTLRDELEIGKMVAVNIGLRIDNALAMLQERPHA